MVVRSDTPAPGDKVWLLQDYVARRALFGMEFLGGILCKVLQHRSSNKVVTVDLAKLVYLAQQVSCSVRVNESERP